MTRWTWTDSLYDVRVFLLKGSGAEAQRFIERTFNDGEKCDQGAWQGAKTLFTEHDRGCALTVWVPEWWNAKRSHDLGVLAHEAMHGALYVLRCRHVELSEGSEEAFTYYVSWLFRNCHERLAGKKAR